MAKYVVKRVLMALLTILLVACITFFLMHAIPGNPWLSDKSPSPEVIAALNAKHGLDKPLHIQLGIYLKNLLHLDMGTSIKMQKNYPVINIIKEMFPVSARIGIIALLWAVAVGVPLGCIAAYNRGKPVDSALRIVCTVGISMPSFVVATLLLMLFVLKLRWLPNRATDPGGLILPIISLSLYPMAYITRLTRSSMLDVLGQDYIRTARAKGLSSFKVIFKHALKNALGPVITYAGPMMAYILTGSMVVENIFSIPGLGRLFVNSMLRTDYMMIMGVTIFLATMIIIMNFVGDVLYKIIDPRIDLG